MSKKVIVLVGLLFGAVVSAKNPQVSTKSKTTKPVAHGIQKVVRDASQGLSPENTKEMVVRLKKKSISDTRGIASSLRDNSTIPTGTTDLSSEIADSKEEEMKAQRSLPFKKEARPNLRTHAPKVISGPGETVEVPDNVDWNHHRDEELQHEQQLNEMTKKAIPQKVDE